MLDSIFRNDPRSIRYGGGENLYGYREIEAFRAARSPAGLARTLSKTVITTYGRDFAVASTLFHRPTMPGKVGRQMQTWVRFAEGWRVVAAHVSVIDEPQQPAEFQTARAFSRTIGAPAAEARNVARAGDGLRLDQKSLHGAPVASFDRADRQRRRHRGDEAAEAFRRQRPDFELDRCPFPSATRNRPGFGGSVPASANRR